MAAWAAACLLCKPGQYCAGDVCKACNTDDHCGPTCQACSSATPRCKDGSTCVECLFTSHCPPGEYCSSNTCQPCSTLTHCGPTCVACATGQTCCGPTGGCASLLTDKLNCGACGKACSTFCNKGLCDASIKCSVALGDDIFSTPAVDSGGNVYVVTSSGKVTSYKPDCTLRWSFSAGYYTTSSPVLSPDEKRVYVSTTGGPATLHALDAATGAKVWSQVVGVGWSDFNTPAVASDGTIYAIGCTASGGTYHQTVQALSPAGVAKWSVNISSTGSSTNTGGPAIAADGTIYALASNGQVSAITAAGQQKWSVSLGCCSTNVSPALGSDGHLYVIASTGKTLYKLNSATGATIWSRSLGSLSVTHVSPVTDGQGNVYLALPDGTVRAWAADGTGLWSLPASGAYNASLAIGSDGVLYAVNGSNGSLRALNEGLGFWMSDEELSAAVGSSPQPIVVGAHTHRPFNRRVDRWWVLNPGAVGVPFNGNPAAQYLILTAQNGDWQADFRAVPYDRSPVYAAWERTGYLERSMAAQVFKYEVETATFHLMSYIEFCQTRGLPLNAMASFARYREATADTVPGRSLHTPTS